MLAHLSMLETYRGPLIALVVALAVAGAGRFLRMGWLSAAAGGAGVVAGWYTITGRLWMSATSVSIELLPGLAAIALLIGMFCVWRGPGRIAATASLLAALAVGWILAGQPRHESALRASWPIGLGVAIVVWLFIRMLADRTLEPMRLALGGLTLAAAFHVAGVPMVWTQLALVPAVAALTLFTVPSLPGPAALPIALATSALACLGVIEDGRLPRLGFGTMDAAAVFSLLAVWLLPRVTERVGFAGRAAPLAGCLLSGTIAVGCVWATRQLLRLG